MIPLRHLLVLTCAAVVAPALSASAHAQNVARFLPRFEAPSHTAREWMARFDHSNGTAVEYLWCLHWLTPRAREPLAPEVVSWLGAWFEHAEPNVRCEIEALLVEHGHPCPAAPEPGGLSIPNFGGPKPYEHARRPGDDETFVRALASADLFERCAAAQELVLRQRHVPAALRALLEIAPARVDFSPATKHPALAGRVLAECAAFAGTAFVEVLREELARLADDEAGRARRRQLLLLATSAELTPLHYRPLLLEVAAVADSYGQSAIDALRWLRTLEDPPLDRLAEGRTLRPRATDPELDHAIELCALRGLRDAPEGAPVVASSVWAVADALAGSDPAHPNVVDRLRQIADARSDASEQALAALCELAPRDSEVIARCVARIDALDGSRADAFELVLAPRVPDVAANAALDRLAARACDSTGTARCLVRSGEFDATKSALARRVHEACRAGESSGLDWQDWEALVRADTGWTFTPTASDTRVTRLWKLLISARTRRARADTSHADEQNGLVLAELSRTEDEFSGGGGPNDPYETLLWAAPECGLVTPALRRRVFELMLDRGMWNTNTLPLMRFLGRLELTPGERALLLHLEYDDRLCFFDGDECVRTYGALLARQGHDAVERAALLRAHAHADGDLEYLDDLLAISEPAGRDLQLVATLLENGPAAQRAHAVALVARRALDTETLRTRIRAAKDDIDTFVAQAARELCVTRGW